MRSTDPSPSSLLGFLDLFVHSIFLLRSVSLARSRSMSSTKLPKVSAQHTEPTLAYIHLDLFPTTPPSL